MAINPVSISSQSVNENTDAVIEVVYTRPDTSAILETPQTPGKLVGYFNGATGFMELYVLSKSGTRYLKI
jgi:hypothetical protein